MNTPICDFVKKYTDGENMRLHMPGHKGTPILGFEKYDITEITGADSLYSADGIIRESEENASALFGCPTYYSTEGASQCIRAMMYLIRLRAGDRPRIAAGRNAHKTFISAAALLDLDVDWLCTDGGSYLSCKITPEYVESYLKNAAQIPSAVYITSPDYLGNTVDIAGVAEVCHRYGVILAVDGAHGAYMHFLRVPAHPMDLGADICCTSAHKTLPVLTGGAYLHTAEDPRTVRSAMAMFGSTSPSYLILQSLDAANAYLESYPAKLYDFTLDVDRLKSYLVHHGFRLAGNEPLKLTILPKSTHGFTGTEMAQLLEARGIFCEFADEDHLVMMFTPEIGEGLLYAVETELMRIPKCEPVRTAPPSLTLPRRRMSIRNASLSPREIVPVDSAVGRILASAEVGCPPAVPIVVCGEEITREAAEAMKYYGITDCTVVTEN